MTKIEIYSKRFYTTILILAIPGYFLLYGASGHSFRLETEDAIWMFTVVIALVMLAIYSRSKEAPQNLIKIFLGGILLVTAFGGLKVIMYLFGFNYGDDVGLLSKSFFLLIPIIFVVSNIILIIEVIRSKRVG